MKKLIGLLLLSAAVFAGNPTDSEEAHNESYGYINLDTFGLIPMFGGGYRYHHGHHGFDASLSTLGFSHARAMYLCYPAKKGPYIGAGVGAVYNAPQNLDRCV